MQHVLKFHGTNTEVAEIKTFHYHDQRTKSGKIRFGNVVSKYIEADYYLGTTSVISEGTRLDYYQRYDVTNAFVPTQTITDVKIGEFIVYSSTPGKSMCRIVAYDDILKMEVNYSQRLLQLKNSFPMTISSLLSDAAIYAGVSLGQYATLPDVGSARIGYFYAENITVRDIFSYATELEGKDVCVSDSGTIEYHHYDDTSSSFWGGSYEYIICPTDSISYYNRGILLKNMFYKQGSFEEQEYTVTLNDSAIVCRSSGDELAIYAPDGTQDNPYIVKGNLLIDYMLSSDIGMYSFTIAVFNYTQIRELLSHSPFKAKLFPFHCYMESGTTFCLAERNGTVSEVPIMSVDWTNEAVTVECFGGDSTSNEYDSTLGTADENNLLTSAQINDLNSRTSILELMFPVSVANGGTGDTGVQSETTISNIISSGSGFTITSATYKQWGKVAQLYIQAKKATAQTTEASMTVGTVVSAKRPAVLVGMVCTDSSILYSYLAAGGTVSARGTWAADATKTFAATYILP